MIVLNFKNIHVINNTEITSGVSLVIFIDDLGFNTILNRTDLSKFYFNFQANQAKTQTFTC